MPGHGHTAAASTDAADVASPNGTVVWANPGVTAYDVSTTTTMSVHAVSNVGTGQPHDNMSPYLVVSFCIALLGIFPSRN
jgi:microcystin-dependent protein